MDSMNRHGTDRRVQFSCAQRHIWHQRPASRLKNSIGPGGALARVAFRITPCGVMTGQASNRILTTPHRALALKANGTTSGS